MHQRAPDPGAPESHVPSVAARQKLRGWQERPAFAAGRTAGHHWYQPQQQ